MAKAVSHISIYITSNPNECQFWVCEILNDPGCHEWSDMRISEKKFEEIFGKMTAIAEEIDR